MATHPSTLAWKLPWTEEPGRLQYMGSLRVGHDWATSLSLFTFMYWRRKWQPTPASLPGESQGSRSLVDCHLWGRTESDTDLARSNLAAAVAAVQRKRSLWFMADMKKGINNSTCVWFHRRETLESESWRVLKNLPDGYKAI